MIPSKIQKAIVLLLSLMIVLALVVLVLVVAEKQTPVKESETVEKTETTTDNGENDSEEAAGNEWKDAYKIDVTPYMDAIMTKEASYLILVNADNPIGAYMPDNIVDSATQKAYSFSSYSINETALAALTAMCLEAKADGIKRLDLTSAFRSYEKQAYLFESYCDEEMRKDPLLTREGAEAIVETYSCRPGTSEHQTGLSVDFRLKWDDKTLLNESFADTDAGKWLAENCTRFGFILRFPKDKTELTGIQFEPWHFRFVGYHAANEMKELGMCLEEYTVYLDSKTVE